MDKEELLQRIKNAISLLTEGHSFKVGDLTFSSKDNNHFSVTGWTICNDLQNLTRHKALSELYETKDVFNKMLAASTELANLIRHRQIVYCLAYDYGMGGLEICSERNGEIEWATTLKD